MAKKIAVEDEQDPNEDPAVVAKVDKMMDPKKQEDPKPETVIDPINEPAADDTEEPSSDLPPLDIFADAPGAPELVKPGSKKKEKKGEPEPEQAPVSEPEQPVDPVASEDVESVPVEGTPIEPDDFDDPTTAKAIDDIVAHESDAVLSIEDSKKAQAEDAVPPEKGKSSHKIFWSLVFIVCLVAVAMAVFIVDPSIHLPLKHLNWSTIKRHL